MRPLFTCLIAFWCISALPISAQTPKDAIPGRFKPISKNEHFRLQRVLGTPELHPSYAATSAISADGRYALFAEDLSSGAEDKVQLRSLLVLFDLKSKAWPREFEITGKTVSAISLSPDGSKVLLAGLELTGNFKTDDKKKKIPESKSYLSLFDLNKGMEPHVVHSKEEFISFVTLLPDGVTALACGAESVVSWNLNTGKSVDIRAKGNHRPQVLGLFPDGKRFFASYFENDKKPAPGLFRWDLGKAEPTPIEGLRNTWQLAVSKDGQRFAAASVQDAVALVNVEDGKTINTLKAGIKGVDELITALAIANDGKTVLSVWSKAEANPDDFNSSRLIAWDGENNKTLWTKTVSYRGRTPILIQGDKILIGGGPNLFESWSIKDGNRTVSWGGHKGPISAVAALPGGEVLSAGSEGILMTWQKGDIKSKRPAHEGTITALALSKDRKQWITAGSDKVARLWTAGQEKPIQELKGHTGSITGAAFSKDGTWAVTASGDRQVKSWNLKDGKEITAFAGNPEGVNAVALSPDERWIASACDDGAIRIWPVNDGKLDPDRDALVLEGHKKNVMCLAFAADGKTLLSGGQDKAILVWDWTKEKVRKAIPGHKNWVTSIELVDAETFLTTSDDLTVCRWEMESGKEIGRIDFAAVSDCPRCLSVDPSGRLLVGTSSWLIYEFQMSPRGKSGKGAGSSNK